MPSDAAVSDPVPVNPDNFIRAESDRYFGHAVADGGFGAFHHDREISPPDVRRVVRQNRDTLYSVAVFDLDAAPVTLTIPDPGDRFISTQIITEDHYVPDVFYGSGRHTLARSDIGTRYAMAAVRILVDPHDPVDVKTVHALQDSIVVEQARTGRFDIPNWDTDSQETVRTALLELASTLPDTRRMFGTKGTTDPVRRLIGSASAWGGNPEQDALYLTVTPPDNDGTVAYRLTIGRVPIDGFWSVTVYDAEGYVVPNSRNAYSLNSLTARPAEDGTVTVQFGGDDTAGVVNWLPTVPGWNYMVRLYRPSVAILNGLWTFPEAQRVD
jgi:hypothetical protein